jgi:hypothetical protein
VEDKYVVPIATMLAGLVVWIAFLIWHAVAASSNEWSPWLEAGLCLAAGGLVAFSAFR